MTATINPYKLFNGSFLPEWLMVRVEVSPGAKLAYGRLMRFAGKSGIAFPHQSTLAKMLGVGERQARRYVAELEENALIHVTQRGLGQSNEYRFLVHPWMNESLDDVPADIDDLPDRTPPTPQTGHRRPEQRKRVTEESPQTGPYGTEPRPAGRSSRKGRPADGSLPDDEDAPAAGASLEDRAAVIDGRRRPRPRTTTTAGRTPPLPTRAEPVTELSRYAADPTTPHHVGMRFIERMKMQLGDDDKRSKVNPANRKELTDVLKRWYVDGIDLDVMVSMVDVYAGSPDRYGPKDAIPWRAFVNARQKLHADASKVAEAANPTAKFGTAWERAARR